MGRFFFIVTLVYTCRAFFCCIIRKHLSQILFWSQLVSVCLAMKLFFFFKIHCLQMFQLFHTRDRPFIFIVTLVYNCHTFFAVSSRNIYLIYCFGYSSFQSVSQWNSFSPLKYIVYKWFSCFRPGMGHFFFIVTLVYTFRVFFGSIIKKYLSHILFWSQLISVCFAMKLFFSFKIHCLQMFQLFHTRDGPFFFFIVTLVVLFLLYHPKIFIPYSVLVTVRLSLFCNGTLFLLQITLSTNVTVVSDQGWANFFIVTLVITCHTFFAVSSENIYPIYCFGHSSSQSVSQWNSFSPSKYIVYKC